MDAIPVEIRWGDRPPIEQGPISRPAIFALLCSLPAPLSLVLAFVLPPKVGALLLLALFSRRIIWIPIGAAYTALFSGRRGTPTRGRMLAWAALALCYGSQLVYTVLFTSMSDRRVAWAPYAVLAMILLHLPVFAAECAAAKYAVVSLLAGCALLSLLSCCMLRSIEQSRRIRTVDQLRQVGARYQEQRSLGNEPPSLERSPRDATGLPTFLPAE